MTAHLFTSPLVGRHVPDAGDGEVHVQVSPSTVAVHPERLRPLIEHFAVSRLEPQALSILAGDEIAAEDLGALVDDCAVVRLPPDLGNSMHVLARLAVIVTDRAKRAVEDRHVLVALYDDGAGALGPATSGIVSRSVHVGLLAAAREAAEPGADELFMWRRAVIEPSRCSHTVHDLSRDWIRRADR